eukprot:gene48802-27924_t
MVPPHGAMSMRSDGATWVTYTRWCPHTGRFGHRWGHAACAPWRARGVRTGGAGARAGVHDARNSGVASAVGSGVAPSHARRRAGEKGTVAARRKNPWKRSERG